MINTRLLTAAALGIGLLALPTIGDAQSFQGNQPIMWGADESAYSPTGLSLRGRAELIQGENRIRADRVEGAITNGSLTRVEASGSVYFVTPEQTIRGDRAVYTPANDTIVLTGDVILTQGENVITGSRLVYNTRTESAQMEGGSNGRVQGVFYPERGN
ncbi:LptA/OstA family protein [Brevundimonas sp. M20]|jgi:lipopolysaccharide export system protein LptA|uniref:LptA/OstA family protein n=1 Tax=Brevundimonas sp. M20 TaxID=2591463 RepID=UPI001146A1AA|nr:LptA/OstA family protein [Brevundimonas sp. M20]QDH74480.1 LPS ABC transporter substrate-binding protein LptA [Brevundimonas sp. M20]